MISGYAGRLLGELIGLARATDGNEHLISDGCTALIVESLATLEVLTPSALERLLQRVEEEKRRMVPACFRCAAPCGRNNAYDLQQLQKESSQTRDQKQQILAGIQALATRGNKEDTEIYYKALIAVGIEGISNPILEALLQRIQALSK